MASFTIVRENARHSPLRRYTGLIETFGLGENQDLPGAEDWSGRFRSGGYRRPPSRAGTWPADGNRDRTTPIRLPVHFRTPSRIDEQPVVIGQS